MAEIVSGGMFLESDVKVCSELSERGFGIAQTGGLMLSGAEALYLVSKGRLTVRDSEGKAFVFESLMGFVSLKDRLMPQKYEVYRHLRENGHVARISKKGDDGYFRVYRKGKRIGDEPAKYLVKVVENKKDTVLGELEGEVRKASALRKELVLAGVEENKNIWFIKIGRAAFD